MRRFQMVLPPDLLASAEYVAKRRKWSTAEVMRVGVQLFIRLEQEDASILLGSAATRLTDIKEECERVQAEEWVRKLNVILSKIEPVQEALRV